MSLQSVGLCVRPAETALWASCQACCSLEDASVLLTADWLSWASADIMHRGSSNRRETTVKKGNISLKWRLRLGGWGWCHDGWLLERRPVSVWLQLHVEAQDKCLNVGQWDGESLSFFQTKRFMWWVLWLQHTIHIFLRQLNLEVMEKEWECDENHFDKSVHWGSCDTAVWEALKFSIPFLLISIEVTL